MAIYHLSVQIISRKSGRSSVAAAAYRAAEKMTDGHTGEIHDFRKKSGVDYSEIMLPDNAPAAFADRATLWNEVEKVEKRKDAQVAREFNIAFPAELTPEQMVELGRSFTQKEFVERGMIADYNCHDLDSTNPHFHIQLTTRHVGPDGFGGKNRDWNNKELLEHWRKAWADHANAALEKAGHDVRIDHRSLVDQGITDREPQTHLGPHACGFEKRTKEKSDRRKMMEERAQQAAREKIKAAEMQAKLDFAIEQATVDMVRIGRALHDYKKAKPAPAPLMDFTTAKKKKDDAQDHLVASRDAVRAARLQEKKAKKSLSDFKKKHPFLSWLHKKIRPLPHVYRLESAIVEAKKRVAVAVSVEEKASSDFDIAFKKYIAVRDEVTEKRSIKVDKQRALLAEKQAKERAQQAALERQHQQEKPKEKKPAKVQVKAAKRPIQMRPRSIQQQPKPPRTRHRM